MREKTFYEVGIEFDENGSETVITTCPRCSQYREKSEKQCLTVFLIPGNEGWHCNHCGWKGRLKPGKKAINTSEIPVFTSRQYFEDSLSDEVVLVMAARGISKSTLLANGIKGLESKVAFPRFYPETGVVGVGFRDYSLDKKDPYHFLQLPKSYRCFWGYHNIFSEGYLTTDTIYITEGVEDALSLYEAGYFSVLSLPMGAGSTAAADDEVFLEALKDIKKVVLVMDNDKEGKKAADDLARRVGYRKALKVEFPLGCKDANSVLVQYGVGKLREVVEAAKQFPVQGLVSVSDVRSELEYIRKNGIDKGRSTGIDVLDELFRWRNGTLYELGAVPKAGKALDHLTEIPTPDRGLVHIGNLRAGDKVYGGDGRPCNVVAVTDLQYNRPLYRITFDNSTTVIADAEHEWPVYVNDEHKLLTTKELLKYKNLAKLEVVKIQGSNSEVDIAPYTLGVWLGDGTSSNGRITTNDPEVYENILLEGTDINPEPREMSYYCKGLQTKLRTNRILNFKHIPEKYFCLDYISRLRLLQGLIDSDGWVRNTGQVNFVSTNYRLADDTRRLASSLGWRTTLRSYASTLNGQPIGQRYIVSFYASDYASSLKRKREVIKIVPAEKQCIGIKTITPLDNDKLPVHQQRAVVCIQVDSVDNTFLCTSSYIKTHNSRLVNQLMLHDAKTNGTIFALFAPESLPVHYHTVKLQTAYIGKPFEQFTAEEFERSYEFVLDHFHWVIPKERDIKSILDVARGAIETRGASFLVVDPFNYISLETEDGHNSIGNILADEVAFTREHNVIILNTVHPPKMEVKKPTKNNEGDFWVDEYPVMTAYDAAGSSHHANRCDVFLSLWRSRKGNYPVQVHVDLSKFEEVATMGTRALLQYDKDSFRFKGYTGSFTDLLPDTFGDTPEKYFFD